MMKILSTLNQIKNFFRAEPLQSVSIRVTKACNLRCKHCYSFSGRKYSNELSLKEIKKLIDEIKQLGAIRIFFTGGEPFIRSDITEILNYADKNNFAIYISTNGTLINKGMITFLKSLKHLKNFQVSIDGFGKVHDSIRGEKGTFIKAVKTLKLAKKELKNTKIAVVFTLMKRNASEVEKVLKLAIQLDVHIFALVPLYPVTRCANIKDLTPKEKYRIFQNLFNVYKKNKGTKLKIGILAPPAIIPKALKNSEYGCGYVCTFPSILGVDANGNVAPCDGLLNYKEFILGNIRKNSLEELWNRPLMKRLRKLKPSDIRGVCRNCRYRSFCMGGCRARAFIEYNDFKAPNPLCQSFYSNGLFPKENFKNSNEKK
ncbi:MAG: radical SAM protein [Candidatus Aenigmatarchaeota archaeon]